MPWVYLIGEQYHLSLTDGYATISEAGRRRVPQKEGESDDEWLARRLYRLAIWEDKPPRRNLVRPNLFHVWVIGSDQADWLNNAPAQIREIAGDVTHASLSYKILINGIDAASYSPRPSDGRSYGGRWDSKIRAAGMTRKQPHPQLRKFREASKSLLQQMYDYHIQTRAPPTKVIEELSVPFVFHGDKTTIEHC